MNNIEKLVNNLNKSLDEYEELPQKEGFLTHLKRGSSFWNYKDKKCRYHTEPIYWKYFQSFLRKNIDNNWNDVKYRLICNIRKRYKSHLNLKWLLNDIKRIENFNLYNGYCNPYSGEYYVDSNNNLGLLTVADQLILLYENRHCSIKDRPNLWQSYKKPKTEVFEYTNGSVIEKTKGIHYFFIKDINPSYYDKILGCDVFLSYERRHKIKQLNRKELKYFNLVND